MSRNMMHSNQTLNWHHTWWVRAGWVMFSVILFIGISISAYMPWWEMALRSDNSPVSWLSSVLIFACSALALQIGIQRGTSSRYYFFLAFSLILLSLDEQFRFHEYWKFHCAEWISWCGYPLAGHVDWLGDAPMMLVGIVGVVIFVKLYRSVDSSTVRKLVVASITVGVVLALGTHFGHASGLLPAWFSRFEEVFEVLSEALFFCALLEMRPPTPLAD